jgi:hypothetical protein
MDSATLMPVGADSAAIVAPAGAAGGCPLARRSARGRPERNA